MLQKILVVIVGLVMSVVGALSPDGLLAGTNEGGDARSLAANTAEETLATLRSSDGSAFARISALWVEVDGRRVTEDAWGTGEVEEIRFKVGVKGVEDVALAVGDKIVELHPTDVITVRMFRGDFSYRGIGTPTATVQLQGTVKTTVLHEGDVSNRVLTQVGDLDLGAKPSAPRDDKVAYVVLTTGEKVDTVAVEDGGSRLYTEEGAVAAEAKDEPGNLLAKWVKIDGKLVREYTWGDGTLGKVEFEPAESASRSVVLAFNGEEFEIAAGERVIVEDFVGEYLVYQVSGGLMRLRLDGYAVSYTTGAALPLPSQGGEGAPLASFDFAPVSPRSTDTVQFRDRSTDDGIIVFRSWDFGDNSSGVLADATHRFAKPGTYEITLSVTDNDLKTSNMTRTIIVRNAEPVADFDFSPKIVTTDTLVAFSDHSYDSDGGLVNWTWDFGDGSSSFQRHPTHRFAHGGNATVTLTVTDDLGGRTSLSKVVNVRNTPPLASFTYAPAAPATLDPVQFFDNSTDTDGSVIAWNWSFGDGSYGFGSSPTHAYARPGIYTVSLTAIDDGGDKDTASTTVIVSNRAPFAEFSWDPVGKEASTPITFTSESTDPDGTVVVSRWSWGDGTAESMGPMVTHVFPSAGTYPVTLTVSDNTLGTSTVMRTVTVANSAPRPNMLISPNPTYRGVEVTFSDLSNDPDGDDIVNWTWDFGDGGSASGRSVRHVFSTVALQDVTLTVTDEGGQTASLTRQLCVLNRPPTLSAEILPRRPAAGDEVVFSAGGVDPDLPGGDVSFEWRFSDGVTANDSVVTRNFTRHGNYTAQVRAVDTEGGISAPITLAFIVDRARPVVDFDWSPVIPRPGQTVNFTDRTFSMNGAIREWRWDFGDGASDSVSTRPNPGHGFRESGIYTVQLTVVDVMDQTNTTSREIIVNSPPIAAFAPPEGALQLDTPFTLQDDSVDPDGTVMSWTWSFSDGFVSHDRHATHPGFSAPGGYPVTLTVEDDRGTNASVTRTLNVLNTPPVAVWSPDDVGGAKVVNSTLSFNGYDRSFDPDGTPLTSFVWTFGDGTPAVSAANTTHLYTRSGRYTVGLQVGDSLGTSVRTPLSHQPLRIEPSHGVTLAVTGTLPDGTEAAINTPSYSVTVKIGGVAVDGAAFFPVGNGYEIALDPSLWVHGDVAVVRVSANFLAGINEIQVQLRDGTHTIPVHFNLRMAARASVTPLPGNESALLAPFLGSDTYYRADPVYGSMFERPHGTGRLTYADGAPAVQMPVDIEARWVPLRALSGARNLTETPDTATGFPSWCRAATAMSDLQGNFAWTFDDPSLCLPNAGVPIYPVGRWEVRARPQVPTAENRLSETAVFYVDPTGGTLLRASFGLA